MYFFWPVIEKRKSWFILENNVPDVLDYIICGTLVDFNKYWVELFSEIILGY